jgi:hypothetical protein
MFSTILQGFGPRCGFVTGRGLTEMNRLEIVQLHNKLRSKIALGLGLEGNPGLFPVASDMQEVVWDNEVIH